ALWLRCQNPQIQPVLAEPGALPEHKIAASTAQVIYQQSLAHLPLFLWLYLSRSLVYSSLAFVIIIII
ncbi:MAG: hypothetical protein LBS10_09505, partial [Gracilibacteraceae bacterium]|nr:hypothetical protein [Gracilibacteraceae bacterium]